LFNCDAQEKDAMNVSDAVASRKSVRAFTDKKVDTSLILSLLEKAARAPSGGNLQPWRIFVINDASSGRFQKFLASKTEQEDPAYDVYPAQLSEPYRSSRFKVGDDMYALLGIPREDRGGRIRRLMENYQFFGAPSAFFCFVDHQMGKPQWSDLGMFLQTFMLLATEAGLATCAQEIWATRPQTVAEFVGAPPELGIFCGMAIGYEDTEAPVNKLISEREPQSTFIKVIT
jgi:nitroreductase